MMKKAIFYLFIPAFFAAAWVNSSNNVWGAVLLDKIVATVNDEVITWSELMNAVMLEAKPYLENITGNQKQERIKELSRPFLNNLIERKLQRQEARRLGVDVSGSEIDSAIQEIKQKFGLSEEAFMQSLQTERLTFKEYKERLANQIIIQKVVNFAVKSKIVVSDKEIEEYYGANRIQFKEKSEMKIRQIFFTASDDVSNREEIENKGNEVYQRIIRGENFEALAKEFSEGPSRESGGDLGYISRGSVLKEIEDVADSLKIGEVSSPFWSSAGLHIIKLENIREGRDVNSIREDIKEILAQKTFELKYHEWLGSLRERANIEIKL